jgi:hypothetical protein
MTDKPEWLSWPPEEPGDMAEVDFTEMDLIPGESFPFTYSPGWTDHRSIPASPIVSLTPENRYQYIETAWPPQDGYTIPPLLWPHPFAKPTPPRRWWHRLTFWRTR